MANSIYKINKGINKSIEFKGLKAQYIGYLGLGTLLLLIAFAIMYIVGIKPFICLAIILTVGILMIIKIQAISSKYGEHGMMKAMAKRSIPKVLKSYSRKIFLSISRR